MTISFSPLWFGSVPGDDDALSRGVRATPSSQAERALPPDDVVLLGRVRMGDEVAFETMFTRHYANLCTLASAYVRSAAVAEEVVSELFTWIWMHRTTWAPNVSIAAALYGLARRRSIDAYRTARAEERRYDVVPGADERVGVGTMPRDAAELAESHDIRAMLWNVVAAFPEGQRTVLTLRWRHALSWEEIAAVTGVSVVAVKRQHGRALAHLRERFPEHLR
jgi:RNA polymerase sigma-70 factor (ECF subfamily)